MHLHIFGKGCAKRSTVFQSRDPTASVVQRTLQSTPPAEHHRPNNILLSVSCGQSELQTGHRKSPSAFVSPRGEAGRGDQGTPRYRKSIFTYMSRLSTAVLVAESAAALSPSSTVRHWGSSSLGRETWEGGVRRDLEALLRGPREMG